MAKPRTSNVPGVSFVQELEGIFEYRIDTNGLRILLIPDQSITIAGSMMTYHVGSRNEATGFTGATHLLEHLMFKESTKFNVANNKPLKWYLETIGARINASTSLDRTNYYQVMPSEVLMESIELEADRMRNLILTKKDLDDEMPIVRNEFEMGENNGTEALDKQIWATAYSAHPYHHNTIGWRSDIENVPIERLQQFYDEFYWPNNATLSIAGNFNTEEILSKVVVEFGSYTSSPQSIPTIYTTEPAQEGQRRTIVKRAGTPVVAIAHKSVAATHDDMPALLLLSMILSGDKTSRLYKVFIDTAKATSVYSFAWQFHDPSLFEIFISLPPNADHARIEKILIDEYEKVKKTGIRAAELMRAKRAYRTYLATRRDGPFAMLDSLNEEISSGDWTRFVTLPKKLEAVTTTDIQRVARTYFVEDQSTVGWFVPTTM